MLSTLLYLAGVAIGAMITDNSAMVPAHYHGAVGAITLALMVQAWCGARDLRLDAIPSRRVQRWQCLLYGGGTLLLVAGLALSGWQGVPRKVAGLSEVPYLFEIMVGKGLMSVGGAMAIAGAALFSVTSLVALSGISAGIRRATVLLWRTR